MNNTMFYYITSFTLRYIKVHFLWNESDSRNKETLVQRERGTNKDGNHWIMGSFLATQLQNIELLST